MSVREPFDMTTKGIEGDLIWFALRVVPQREKMVCGILQYDGLKAHYKTEMRLRRKTRRDPVRKEMEFCGAPGYVFVGLSAAQPYPWRLARKLHLVRSVVTLNGAPAQLDPFKLVNFLKFRDESLPDYFKFFKTGAQEFKIGDMLRITQPSFEGFELPLQDIRDGEAIFHLLLMNQQTELRIPIDQCYKPAAKAA